MAGFTGENFSIIPFGKFNGVYFESALLDKGFQQIKRMVVNSHPVTGD